jgi:hypothetical protein
LKFLSWTDAILPPLGLILTFKNSFSRIIGSLLPDCAVPNGPDFISVESIAGTAIDLAVSFTATAGANSFFFTLASESWVCLAFSILIYL